MLCCAVLCLVFRVVCVGQGQDKVTKFKARMRRVMLAAGTGADRAGRCFMKFQCADHVCGCVVTFRKVKKAKASFLPFQQLYLLNLSL